jgi:Na+/melibiose symporter-like transporter
MVEISNDDAKKKLDDNDENERDNTKSSKNVSEYLSLTAVSMLINQYLGGFLLNYLTVRQIFAISASFPFITLVAGVYLKEEKQNKEEMRTKVGFFKSAKRNFKTIIRYITYPFILKPLIFILFVIIAPGVDTSMFYYNSNVLHMDSSQIAITSVLGQVGNIAGQQFYRLFCNKLSFKRILLISTLLYSINLCLKLLITEHIIDDFISPVAFTYIISWVYSFVSSIHLMPIMVLACDMCPKSVEATFYSFVLALINLGYLISYQLGGILSLSLNITSTNFSGLNTLIIIAAAYPILSLAILFWLVPNQKDMDEQFRKFRMN